MPCAGDPLENCGGSNELRLFSITGTLSKTQQPIVAELAKMFEECNFDALYFSPKFLITCQIVILVRF